jgi:hypothetical protein
MLAIISVATAIKVMSLVESRDEKNNRVATDLFTEEEIIVLLLISRREN